MLKVLVITGPVGVGKTTVGFALSEALSAIHVPHALVDMDALRSCYPSPPDDPFHMRLGFRNLAAVWANYQAVGAQRLIVVDVVETREQRADYEAAVPGAHIQIVRLEASTATLHQRLNARETGASLAWHQARAVELSALMEERGIGDVVIDTDARPVADIVREILTRTLWG